MIAALAIATPAGFGGRFFCYGRHNSATGAHYMLCMGASGEASPTMEDIMRKIWLAAALTVSLAACAQPGGDGFGISKQTGGAVLGGAGGALAGSQFGKGKGQLATTALGTLLGAWLGSEAGTSLDRADRAYANQPPRYSYGPQPYQNYAPAYGAPQAWNYAPPPAYAAPGPAWGGGWNQPSWSPPEPRGYATVPPRY
jgi:surface antigen